MRKLRKIICVVLFAALVLSLAACAGNGTGADTTAPESDAPSVQEDDRAEVEPEDETDDLVAEDEEEPGDDEDVTATGLSGQIRFMSFSLEASEAEWMELMIASFREAHPDVSIEVQRISIDTYVMMLQTQVASGDAPDIFQIEGAMMHEFHDNGFLADLTGSAVVNSFNQEDLVNLTFDGMVKGVPISTTTMAVIYNRDAFVEAGISEVPTTLDEFHEVLAQLQESGIYPIAAGFMDGWCIMADMQADYITAVLSREPDSILDLISREKTFADSQLWYDVFDRMFYRYQFTNSDPFGTNWSTVGDLLATGRAAMVLNGSWTISHIRDRNPDANLGVFAFPYDNSTDRRLLIQTPHGGYSVFSGSDNLETAKAFLAHMYTPENASLWTSMRQGLSLAIGAEPPADPAWEDVFAYIGSGDIFMLGTVDHNFPHEFRNAVETITARHLLNPNRTVAGLLADLDTEFDRIHAFDSE